MAADPGRTTSFAKSLDPDPPQKSISSDFNRNAAGVQRELPLRGGALNKDADDKQMVQKDQPAPHLTPNGTAREQPDRQSYNARLEQERDRVKVRNEAAVARARGPEKDRDRDM
jgi:hypothetical protein